MKNKGKALQGGLRMFLCGVLFLGMIPAKNFAQANKAKIRLDIGQPSIWSLSQAHYMLASMRERNRGLAPATLILDPNASNAYRFDVLKQIFGGDVQANGVAGANNQLLTQNFQQEAARKQSARAKLDETINERQATYDRISRIARRLTPLEIRRDAIKAIAVADRTDAQKTELAQLENEISD